jgi:hypothetical protein
MSGKSDTAEDTGAVKGTAPYFNRRGECSCRGVPDGQHIPPCGKNESPFADRCPNCGFRSAKSVSDGVTFCGICNTAIDGAPVLGTATEDAEAGEDVEVELGDGD